MTAHRPSRAPVEVGPASDDVKELDAEEFAVRWEGSLLAPDTGEYEFLIRTDQSGKLWVNDNKQPLVDASVKSGNDTEFRGSTYLVAGHAYPLRIEFSRTKLGVQKNDKPKAPPVKAFFALEWKRPRRALEVVAQRHLFPASTSPVFVVRTPFPPDDRSAGYERGTAVSKEWLDAATEGALEVTTYIAANLADLAGVAAGATDRSRRLRDFCAVFAERAFRRPLTAEQRAALCRSPVRDSQRSRYRRQALGFDDAHVAALSLSRGW